jgi:pimeloyl-ACP methyl ester carboxylesterase
MRSDVRERRVSVGECTLNVAEAGSGPAVLLLHGFPDRWRLWRRQIPALVEAGYRVIAPDLRGFGESDRPVEVAHYRLSHLVGDVRGLLDACEVEQAAVVGHDWGAGLAWAVASFLGERVNALVPISVGHGLTRAVAGEQQRQLSWYMLWFLFPGVAEKVLPADDWAAFRVWAAPGTTPGSHPEVERRIADLSRPGALTAALNWYRANIDPERYLVLEPQSQLPPVTCPTMGIWSDGDRYLSEVQMTASADWVSGPWRYERVTGAGHWIPEEAPDRLNALLLDFLPASARR